MKEMRTPLPGCPRCESQNTRRFGVRDGTQVFICLNCSARFPPREKKPEPEAKPEPEPPTNFESRRGKVKVLLRPLMFDALQELFRAHGRAGYSFETFCADLLDGYAASHRLQKLGEDGRQSQRIAAPR
jgi:hypothetical protein